MDIGTATSVITTATAAVNLFDKVADQVVRFMRKDSTLPAPPEGTSVSGEGKRRRIEGRVAWRDSPGAARRRSKESAAGLLSTHQDTGVVRAQILRRVAAGLPTPRRWRSH